MLSTVDAANRAFIASDFFVEHHFFQEVTEVRVAANLDVIVVICYPDHPVSPCFIPYNSMGWGSVNRKSAH
jgi:hypothetical protein